jgi:hypothetical protein
LSAINAYAAQRLMFLSTSALLLLLLLLLLAAGTGTPRWTSAQAS